MNWTGLIAVSIACFTLLLIAGMWKADRDQNRALLRELAAQASPDQLAEIRRQAGLS